MTKRRGPKAERASRPAEGHQVLEPPITRDEAGAILGATVSAATWAKVERAFEAYSAGLADLDTTKANANKKDPDGWKACQTETVSQLENALDLIGKAKKRRRFLHEVTDLYEQEYPRPGAIHDAAAMLDGAFLEVVRALEIVARAKPERIEVASQPELERELARRLRNILAEAGLPATLSRDADLPEPKLIAKTDLTPFEQLLYALGVYVAAPSALHHWVRRTFGERN